MIKVKLMKSRSKWGKKMEQIVSPRELCAFTRLFFQGLTDEKILIKMER